MWAKGCYSLYLMKKRFDWKQCKLGDVIYMTSSSTYIIYTLYIQKETYFSCPLYSCNIHVLSKVTRIIYYIFIYSTNRTESDAKLYTNSRNQIQTLAYVCVYICIYTHI